MEANWSSGLDGEDAAAYDALVAASPSGHPSQTRSWAAVATAAAKVSPRFVTVKDGSARLVGAALVSRPRAAGVSLPWAWIDRGPVVEHPSALCECLAAIETAARARGVVRLGVMPYWSDDDAESAEQQLAARGYHDVQRADGAHARTLRVALALEGAALLAGASMQQVRWRAKQAERAGAAGRKGGPDDWPAFRSMHGAQMRRQGRSARSTGWWRALEDYLSEDPRGSLFVTEHSGSAVSACAILRHGERATYTWGASVPEDLPFTKAIPALLSAVRWAHAQGCTVFDLGGIPLEGDSNPKRAAVAMLKRDFSRRPVRLVRAHARWLLP